MYPVRHSWAAEEAVEGQQATIANRLTAAGLDHVKLLLVRLKKSLACFDWQGCGGRAAGHFKEAKARQRAAGTGMTGKGIMLIRLLPGDYAGAGKGQTSPCFENTEIFRGNPAVGKNMRRGSLSVLQAPKAFKIVMAVRQKQWPGPGPRAAAGQ